MSKINWKVRAKSPQFWIGMIGVVLSPVLAYLGIGFEDLTTWDSVANVFVQFFTNPYLIGTAVMAGFLVFLGGAGPPTKRDTRHEQGRGKKENGRKKKKGGMGRKKKKPREEEFGK